jgi:CDP-6-deoxy-D-xylo-4-hexulose-3-dehydrase
VSTDKGLREQIASLVRQYYREQFSDRTFNPETDLAHYAGRVFDAEEMCNLVDASLDFFLTANRYAEKFEAGFADYMGVSNALLVNSGSSANLVALTTLTSPMLGDRRLKAGDEVVTVAAAFPTTVAPILQNNLVPVFVDVNLGDYTANPDQLREAIGPRTRAIMMAHTLGVPFDLDVVADLARRHELWVVEDNCDALGSRYRDRLTGTFGHLATVSFYPAHHITMGEGGAVVTNDDQLGRIARSFRDWGRDCYCAGGESNTCGTRFSQQFGTLPYGFDHKYVYSHIGYNLKLTDMQAAIGCAQLEKLDDFIARRRANFAWLKNRLQGCSEFLQLPQATPRSDPSWFGFPLLLRPQSGIKRTDLIDFLDQARIGTRLLFAGNLTKQPYMAGRDFRVSGELTNTDIVMSHTFWLGTFPGLGEPQLEYVAGKLETFLGVNF